MFGLFHDTLFALFVRALLGPTYFPHLDEMAAPNVYPRTIKKKESSLTTLGRAVEDHDDPLNARGRGYGSYDEREAHATQPAAAQSSTTMVMVAELPKPAKEEGSDFLLVAWYGQDDPEVRQSYQPIQITLLILPRTH
jgi:hypothetical protein